MVHTRLERVSAGSASLGQLSKYNRANDNKHNLYVHSKQGMVNAVLRNNLLGQLLGKYFQSKVLGRPKNKKKTQFLGQQYVRYLISKPIFKETSGKVNVVLFVYNTQVPSETLGVNNSLLLVRMLNNLSQGSTSLNRILSAAFGKEVEVEAILLKYDYLSSEIFSDNLSRNVNRFGTYKKGYTRVLNSNITLMDSKSLALRGVSRDQIAQVLNNNALAGHLGAGVDAKEFLNKGNVVWNSLNNKHLVGFSFQFAGKLPKSISTARTLKEIRFNGTLKCNTSGNASVPFALNSRISNISVAQKSNINKNGKYNVRIKLGHV